MAAKQQEPQTDQERLATALERLREQRKLWRTAAMEQGVRDGRRWAIDHARYEQLEGLVHYWRHVEKHLVPFQDAMLEAADLGPDEADEMFDDDAMLDQDDYLIGFCKGAQEIYVLI